MAVADGFTAVARTDPQPRARGGGKEEREEKEEEKKRS